MTWAFIIAAVVIVAAIAYYFRGRRNRCNDLQICADPHSETSFYPEIEKCHAINTKSITCSCPDFRHEREQFRHDDPRRLCRHLVRSFIDANSLPEDLILYKEGIERSDQRHSGFPTDRKKFDTLVGGKRISIMTPQETDEADSWIDVYCEAGRYSYSPKLERWADQKAPPDEGDILRFLYEKVGRPLPEVRVDKARSPERSSAAKRKGGERTVERTQKELSVQSVLRTLLPPDEELTLKDTRRYVAVMFNGSRKWICRLCLHSKKSKYIEFPDGRRYALNCVEDIAKYREQLVNAYSEKSPKKGKARMLFPASETTLSSHNLKSMESSDSATYFSRN